MTQAVFVHEGQSIDYTPSADVAAGEVVVQGKLVGVARIAIEANKLGALAVEGVYDVTKDSSTVEAGDPVYWDAVAKKATTTVAGNAYMGLAIKDAASGAATVRVKLVPCGCSTSGSSSGG
jgi:predicted RecA/RadA family phage recombinase